MTRKKSSALLVLLVVILVPASASATFHLMKIVEIFPGSVAEPSAQYIMLQMYFPGQNHVGGHSVSVFDPTGASLGTFTFAGPVANGANLATILIATIDAQTVFGISADLTMMSVIQPAGGAVCYENIDCESWGSFSAPGALPVMPGTPFNASTGLVLDMAMHRNLSSGGTVTAFSFALPAPENNAGMSGMLTGAATPTPAPVQTPSTSSCVGDCSDTMQVTVTELITMVNIALGTADILTCLAGDADRDGTITINEIIAAVNNALNGCPAS